MNNVLFSSKKMDWATPDYLFNSLNDEFHFTLDAAADALNHKCEKYFDICDNGLLQPWDGYIVFCNPPYGRNIFQWVKKAYDEHLRSIYPIVLLLPARTDTIWFHRFIYNIAEIRFLSGRIKFKGAKNSEGLSRAVIRSLIAPEYVERFIKTYIL